MAMTPEKKVKNKVVAQLKELGCYYFFPVTGGFGGSGLTDIVGCYFGGFFVIECKAGNNKPTPLQLKNLREVIATGGKAMVVNETNVHLVSDFIKSKDKKPFGFTLENQDDK